MSFLSYHLIWDQFCKQGFHLTEESAPVIWVVKEQKQLLHKSNVFWKYFMLKIQKNICCSKRKNILHDDIGTFRRCCGSTTSHWSDDPIWQFFFNFSIIYQSQNHTVTKQKTWYQWITEACGSRNSCCFHERTALDSEIESQGNHAVCSGYEDKDGRIIPQQRNSSSSML